eukprot:SAG22_NODE_747_length_7495_cov_7.582342_6_plen_265_part_00
MPGRLPTQHLLLLLTTAACGLPPLSGQTQAALQPQQSSGSWSSDLQDDADAAGDNATVHVVVPELLADGADAAGGNANATAVPALTIGADGTTSASVTLGLDLGAWSADAANYELAFRQDVAEAVGVEPSFVRVDGVSAGSVVVDFTILARFDGTPVHADIAQRVQGGLARGVTMPRLGAAVMAAPVPQAAPSAAGQCGCGGGGGVNATAAPVCCLAVTPSCLACAECCTPAQYCAENLLSWACAQVGMADASVILLARPLHSY